jgi:3-hydroxymyristoyl/3-hydroxydecanoyl-(acyl carrier protein) dehydratase
MNDASWTIPDNHPSFLGHFPNAPILPGVVILDKAINLLSRALAQPYASFVIKNAKFFRPLLPASEVVFSFQFNQNNQVNISLHEGEHLVLKCLVALPVEHQLS